MSSARSPTPSGRFPGERGPASFRTTHWSLVNRAGAHAAGELQSASRRRALGSLLELYWYPVYLYARRKGNGAEDARDLVQAFFTSLLESGSLAQADAQRGRFRSFLLTSFSHFATNQWHHDHAHKRGGLQASFSLDQAQAEARYDLEPAQEQDAERIFLRSWAQTLMETVLLHVAAEYQEKGKQEIFEALKPILVGSPESESYGKIASELDVSEGAVKVAAHRLRRRFGEVLRQEIAHTLTDPADLEDEIRGLFSALSGS